MNQENLKIMNEQLSFENKELKDDILIYKDDINRLRIMIENLQNENYQLKEKNLELEKFKKQHLKFNKDGKIAVKELLKLISENENYSIYPSENLDIYQIYDLFTGKLILTINDCYNNNLYPGLLITPSVLLLKDMKQLKKYNTITDKWELFNNNYQKKYDFSNKNYNEILNIFEKLCDN